MRPSATALIALTALSTFASPALGDRYLKQPYRAPAQAAKKAAAWQLSPPAGKAKGAPSLSTRAITVKLLEEHPDRERTYLATAADGRRVVVRVGVPKFD